MTDATAARADDAATRQVEMIRGMLNAAAEVAATREGNA